MSHWGIKVPNAAQEANDIEPEVLGQFGLPTQHQSRQVMTMRLQELVDGVLGQGVGVAYIQGL